MAVLLLARGDQATKDLLRRAFEARYGIGAPAVDTLKIVLRGRIRTKIGPIKSWIPLEVNATFRPPMSFRWDFVTRPAGLPLGGGSYALFEGIFRRKSGRDPIEIVTDPQELEAVKTQLWVGSSIILTPLSDFNVELQPVGERALIAINTPTGSGVTVRLRNDYTLDFVEARCYNHDSGIVQTFSLVLEDGLAMIDNFMFPSKVTVYWDDEAEFELCPEKLEVNPVLDDAIFRLED